MIMNYYDSHLRCDLCKYLSKDKTRDMEWTHSRCNVVAYLYKWFYGKDAGWYAERAANGHEHCIFKSIIEGLPK